MHADPVRGASLRIADGAHPWTVVDEHGCVLKLHRLILNFSFTSGIDLFEIYKFQYLNESATSPFKFNR